MKPHRSLSLLVTVTRANTHWDLQPQTHNPGETKATGGRKPVEEVQNQF